MEIVSVEVDMDSKLQEPLSARDEDRRHAGERKGNYLLVRVIKRVIKHLGCHADVTHRTFLFS